jgi:hypothetical protein
LAPCGPVGVLGGAPLRIQPQTAARLQVGEEGLFDPAGR